jgi:hypothetical protein
MATNRNSETSERRGAAAAGRALRKTAAAAVTTETLFEIVQRLGLLDLVINQVRARLEDTDTDELFEDIVAYVRRNPEVIVVALATLTVTAGALVYLSRRREEDEEPARARVRKVS